MAERAERALSGVALIPLDGAILDAAAALELPALRTLDAIHLASALSLGKDLAVYTYDVRLAEAAADAGVAVRAPS
jgi:predicted nucleic acid-binding protein